MTTITDRRRDSHGKNTTNRSLFIARHRAELREAHQSNHKDKSIFDVKNKQKIKLKKSILDEPQFKKGQGGVRENVFVGNQEFVTGDKIKRQEQEASEQGSNASNVGEGLDDFSFELTADEFFGLYFDELELPQLEKRQAYKETLFDTVRGGYTKSGIVTNLSIKQTLSQSLARRILTVAPLKRKIEEKSKLLKEALAETPQDTKKVKELRGEIFEFRKRIKQTAFLDEIDLRIHNRAQCEKPSTQAVMFCLMDVSGSMDSEKKSVAKNFFMLLYLFLSKSYKHIELVFIRHHTTAKRVSENDFFYSRETGGTVVSSALELMREIIAKDFPTSEWNLYGCYSSDGDNWQADSPVCSEILERDILPQMQCFNYIEIKARKRQTLWFHFSEIAKLHPNFTMEEIAGLDEVHDAFRSLFKRK